MKKNVKKTNIYSNDTFTSKLHKKNSYFKKLLNEGAQISRKLPFLVYFFELTLKAPW